MDNKEKVFSMVMSYGLCEQKIKALGEKTSRLLKEISLIQDDIDRLQDYAREVEILFPGLFRQIDVAADPNKNLFFPDVPDLFL